MLWATRPGWTRPFLCSLTPHRFTFLEFAVVFTPRRVQPSPPIECPYCPVPVGRITLGMFNLDGVAVMNYG